MSKNKYLDMDITNLPTPAFIVDERLLKRNLETLKNIISKLTEMIKLALKGRENFICKSVEMAF